MNGDGCTAAGKANRKLQHEKGERIMSLDKVIKSNKVLLFLFGAILLVLGITFVLIWWGDVVRLFKGFIGMFVALGGMLLLYMVKE
jgi:hypothetical protein